MQTKRLDIAKVSLVAGSIPRSSNLSNEIRIHFVSGTLSALVIYRRTEKLNEYDIEIVFSLYLHSHFTTICLCMCEVSCSAKSIPFCTHGTEKIV